MSMSPREAFDPRVLAAREKARLVFREARSLYQNREQFRLIEEADKIANAQKARGADFETGKLTERAKALLPLLVPLFVSAFRRADELAIAMESRCYHGGEGRTRMKKLHMTLSDVLTMVFSVLFLAGIIVLARFGL